MRYAFADYFFVSHCHVLMLYLFSMLIMSFFLFRRCRFAAGSIFAMREPYAPLYILFTLSRRSYFAMFRRYLRAAPPPMPLLLRRFACRFDASSCRCLPPLYLRFARRIDACRLIHVRGCFRRRRHRGLTIFAFDSSTIFLDDTPAMPIRLSAGARFSPMPRCRCRARFAARAHASAQICARAARAPSAYSRA